MIFKKNRFRSRVLFTVLFLSMTIALMPIVSFAHGAKGHDENAFSNYDAIKKSMELFDKLLEKKKLTQDWEFDFSNITAKRSSDGEKIVVEIVRIKGDPSTLYIFFDDQGKYKGSNFKGNS